jgi:hypothetical protein
MVAIGDVTVLRNALGQRNGSVPLFVGLGCPDIEHDGL